MMDRHDSSHTASHVAPGTGEVPLVHPRSTPILDESAENGAELPFEEGARDVIDPDLRHRMISETAYGMYVQRGYEDGHDQEDWLAAEAAVEHLLLRRPRAEDGAVSDASADSGT